MLYYYANTSGGFILLFIIVTLFALWAQANVNRTFKKFSKVLSRSGRTGTDAAKMILSQNGIYDISISHINGNLTDNYDPTKKVINLSNATINSSSVAAIGVAAHEAGHAVQDNENYGAFRIRRAIVPVTSFMSNISMPLILLGLFIMSGSSSPSSIGNIIANVGIISFSFAVFFQLITLPVEFNASARAVSALSSSGMDDEELKMTKKVLTAAALTYVAALAVALVNLIRIIMIVNNRRR